MHSVQLQAHTQYFDRSINPKTIIQTVNQSESTTQGKNFLNDTTTLQLSRRTVTRIVIVTRHM